MIYIPSIGFMKWNNQKEILMSLLQSTVFITQRLLDEPILYQRATSGIAGLPLLCRPGISSALNIYSRIGVYCLCKL